MDSGLRRNDTLAFVANQVLIYHPMGDVRQASKPRLSAVPAVPQGDFLRGMFAVV